MNSRDDWVSWRRAELRDLFARYIYGHAPPPVVVRARTITAVDAPLPSVARYTEAELTLGDGPVRLHLALFLPVGVSRPRVFLALNKCGNQEALLDPRVRASDAWIEPGVCGDSPEAARGVRASHWPVAAITARGYAFATLHESELDPDRGDDLAFADGVHPHFVPAGRDPRVRWGRIAAWAWGRASRDPPQTVARAFELTSRAAFAQTAPVQAWQPPPAWGAAPPASVAGPTVYLTPPMAADWPRFRFGIASNFTVGAASDVARGVNAVVFAFGFTVDLGAQLSRSLAVFARASGATLILVNQAALFATVEYTPVDWFSLGTGLGWMGLSSPLTELSTSSSFSAPEPRRGNWGGLAMPAVVAFNLGERNPMSERLSAFRIGLEGVFGVETGTGIIGWSASISLGYVRM